MENAEPMLASEPAFPRYSADGHGALDLRLFGAFSVCCEGRTLPGLRTRKDLWLLALLVLHGVDAPIERSRLAGLLWPEARESRALSNLRRSLSELREALGSQSKRIESPTPRTLRLDLAEAQCDVLEFDRMNRSADEASLLRAVELYRGPLLPDCFEDWIAPERDARQRALLASLDTLAEQAKRRGDLTGAANYLRRALQVDSFREPAVRQLMQTLAEQRSHAAAGEVYRAFRLELRRAMNAEPASETVQLSRDIRAAARQAAAPARTIAPADTAPTTLARHRLPVALSLFVGRQAESAAVIDRLRRARLVTLTGTGGAGKTSLAIAVADALGAEFRDGVCFIDLTTLSDPAHIPMLILTELDKHEPEQKNLSAALEEFLRPQNLLLLLDNCEHLVEDCARLADTLLKKCPQLRLLATSREPLHVPGEIVWPVPGLVQAEATRLFAERAAQARYGFQMTDANTEGADRICRRLEGMPLAIEMAAARTRGMSVPQIASEMDDIVRLLNQRGGNVDPRQRTLRATLDWSYRLLDEAGQRLLNRLSLFVGGCTLALTTAVCSDDTLSPEDIPDAMLGLVEKSLVEYSEAASGKGRYRLLETTRAYAAEALSTEEHARLSDRRVDFFVAQAKTLVGMQGDPTGGENDVLAGLEAELPNIRAALTWCQSGGSSEHGLLIAGYLWKFWWVRGHLTEGRQHIMAALEGERETNEHAAITATAFRAAGILAYFQWDFGPAQACYESSLSISRGLPNEGDTASLLLNLGLLFTAQGDLKRGRASLEEALDMFAASDAEHCVQKCRHALGDIMLAEGDLTGARECYEAVYRHFESVGDLYQLSGTCEALASVHREAAIRDTETAEAAWRNERGCMVESLKIRAAIGAKTGIAACVERLGSMAIRHGHFRQAAILHAAGAVLRESADGTRLGADESALIEEDNRKSRVALGKAEFEAARTEGIAMTAEEAVTYALSCGDSGD